MLKKVAILGSNDDLNWDYVGGYDIISDTTALNYTLSSISNTNHYEHIKIVIQNSIKKTGFNLKHLKFFGDIYR